MLLRVALVLAIALATADNLHAASAAATVNSIDANGVGAALGTITFRDTKDGLLITPSLSVFRRAFTGSTSTRKAHAALPSMRASRQRASPRVAIMTPAIPRSISALIAQRVTRAISRS
jgi:hypothetical protein